MNGHLKITYRIGEEVGATIEAVIPAVQGILFKSPGPDRNRVRHAIMAAASAIEDLVFGEELIDAEIIDEGSF